MIKNIQLTVNGAPVSAAVEPRLQLADFLRDHLALTGTHLGCEHGVCGACTIEVDGAPVRSCIAYAAACDGSHVRTIEGFDDDPVMAELREAFSAEHALQCGYCTPGMLVTARDIVVRLPRADEARIREELSGNLCRCTGYVGIVRAIQSVLAKRGGNVSAEGGRSSFDFAAAEPVLSLSKGSGRTESAVAASSIAVRPEPFDFGASAYAQDKLRVAKSKDEQPNPQTTLHESFTVDHPRATVWDFFGHLDEVTACLPGASVIGTPTAGHVDIKLQVRLGPIAPEFEGAADVQRDPSTFSGTIRGSAQDTRSSSTTRGEIRYVLIEEKNGTATRVDIDVAYALTGALAQFSRTGIVQDIAKRMTAVFAQNLQARLGQREGGSGAERAPQAAIAELDAGSLFVSVLWNRIKAFFRSLGGR